MVHVCFDHIAQSIEGALENVWLRIHTHIVYVCVCLCAHAYEDGFMEIPMYPEYVKIKIKTLLR